MPEQALRRGAYDDLPSIVIGNRLTIEPLPPAVRFVFRGGAEAAGRAGSALGLPLPSEPCRAASNDRLAALWLGPDEWLLIAPEGAGDTISGTVGAVALPHSLVDVSHRQTGLTLSGTQVRDVLSSGCPLDLDPAAFPVGMCTRTLFAGVEIVLWHTEPDRFRLEHQRSVAGCVHAMLAETARELEAG